ncbi:MAG TPA: 2-amino-4-hydroxy-6-hydroxymethyldihydropteridine diphosphokinase [Vicinamibacterales bacterium]|nr:2-amino-4-hydroxy-6-hydroxymethyldihydropteridine diphosphokinase [Vicinamibacterales bacterium]
MTGESRVVAVALGANLGDRRAAILHAADRLTSVLADFRLSPIIETAPVGAGLEHDPLYLNAAGVGRSDRPARELLDVLLAIERDAGRTRAYQGAPRTLDLDLLLVGGEVHGEEGLIVPHPRFRDRLFVLEPLAQIAPDLKDPVTGKTMEELLAEVRGR